MGSRSQIIGLIVLEVVYVKRELATKRNATKLSANGHSPPFLCTYTAEKATVYTGQLANMTACFLDHPAGYICRRFTVTLSASLTGTWSH